jgi:guanine nucleotide-binding protein G(i) subunit alpha
MGGCQSAEEKEQNEVNAQIENMLKAEQIAQQKEIKMLLLGEFCFLRHDGLLINSCLSHITGAGESGKSTILKQMKLMHDNGYSNDERLAYKEVVYSNIIQSMKSIIEAMGKLDVSLGDPSNEPHMKLIADQPHLLEVPDFPANISNAVKALWADSGVQRCFSRANEYQLNDSAK